ncbi:hypothetical protein ACF06W_13205 [Streptomyces albus]|uniref:hypothetical protein n=1 Tax=Streptomyces albus TaxID=1888 RepID=UPI0036FA65B4
MRRRIPHCPHAWPWNAPGRPVVNVPAALVGPGRPPVGVQLPGPAGSEPLLVFLAAQLEAGRRWWERWPPGV